MSKGVHFLDSVNEETKTGVCANCGPVGVVIGSKGYWRCRVARDADNRRTYKDPKYKAARDRAQAKYRMTAHGKAKRAEIRARASERYNEQRRKRYALLKRMAKVFATLTDNEIGIFTKMVKHEAKQ